VPAGRRGYGFSTVSGNEIVPEIIDPVIVAANASTLYEPGSSFAKQIRASPDPRAARFTAVEVIL
jgi:hypothetical protein